MVKVSISLPNNTQITFESDEAEVLREIVSMALRDLPRDLMQAPATDGEQPASGPAEKSTSVAGSAFSAAAEPEPELAPAIEPPAEVASSAPVPVAAPAPSQASKGDGQAAVGMPPELQSRRCV